MVPPRSVSQLRAASEPEARAHLDRVLLTGAEETVDELRRSTPLLERRLPDGAVVHEPAHGVAALAIVKWIVTPQTPSKIGRDVDHGAYAAGQWTLAWDFPSWLHSDRTGQPIGSRLGDWVRDFGVPMLPEWAVEAALDLRNRIGTAQGRLWRAQEDALVLQGREGDIPVGQLSDLNLQDEIDHRTRELNALVAERARMAEVLRECPGRSGDSASLSAGADLTQPNLSSEASQRAPESSHLGRGALSVPDPFDEIDVIGDQRRQLFSTRMEPLARWLEGMPSDWVATRHAQLGLPEAHVDRKAARLRGARPSAIDRRCSASLESSLRH